MYKRCLIIVTLATVMFSCKKDQETLTEMPINTDTARSAVVDEEMAATFDSSATMRNPLYCQMGGRGDVSEFNVQEQIANEKKKRIERFWNETTQKLLSERVCEVD